MSRDAGQRGIGVVARAGFAVALAALLAGCGASRPKPQNYDKALDSDTVTMLDSKVTTQISRQKEWTERVNGFLKVHVLFRNLGGKNLKVEVKTDFKDDNGGAVEDPNAIWEPVAITPHADLEYTKLCPKQTGSAYHVYVRIGKDSQ